MANDPQDTGLDRLLAEARQDQPGADLMARVLADAARVQAGGAAQPATASKARRGITWWRPLINAVGGWPGVSGVTAAGVVGLAVGLYAPDLVDTLSGGQLWTLTGGSGATPDIGTLWAETGDV